MGQYVDGEARSDLVSFCSSVFFLRLELRGVEKNNAAAITAGR